MLAAFHKKAISIDFCGAGPYRGRLLCPL